MDDKKSWIRRVWRVVDFFFPIAVLSGWLIYRYFTVGLTSYVQPFELIIIAGILARMVQVGRK